MAGKRILTVIKESDHKSKDSLNECMLLIDGRMDRVTCTDETLNIERLRDKLIASGTDPDLLEEFETAVTNLAYENGASMGSEMEGDY